jgi:hypothetical protein
VRPGRLTRPYQTGRWITPQSLELLLGHVKLESTVRYLGIELDDSLVIAKQTDI